MASRTTHRLLLLAAAGLFSTAGAAIKATSLNAWQVSAFRSAIAAVFVLALVPSAVRGFNWRILPVALAYALTLDLFVAATKLTTAANAIFLQSTAPLYVLLLSPWLLKERIHTKDVGLIAAVGAGMALIFIAGSPQRATAPDPAMGNLLAMLSGMSYGCALVGMRWIHQHQFAGSPMVTLIAVGNVLATLLCLPRALPVIGAQASDWAVVVFLGVFQIGLGYLCLTTGLKQIPTIEASTLLLIEPVLNALLAWLIHGETMLPAAMVGGALIIGATLGDVWWASRAAREAI